MPKERRRRTTTHDQSVKLQFATVDGPPAILADETPNLTKREKRQLQHDLFLQRLESSHTPYSKSHVRRLKRKAKEEIASGLQDVALALPPVDDEVPTNKTSTVDADTSNKSKFRRKQKAGQIGEGKGAPLSIKQRQRVLKTERLRQPLLLATPEFASNPFQALRTHAQNTLEKHQLK